jgi:PAS domain-containing protein
MAPATRRLLLLVILLAAVAALGLQDRWPSSAAPVPVATTQSPLRTPDSMTTVQRQAKAKQDSSDHAQVEWLIHRWLGPERWVATAAGDSSVELIEAGLVDSSAADLMQAFVSIPTLRDSAGQIELVGGSPAARAILVGNVDSLVREEAQRRMGGCLLPVTLPVRHLTNAHSAAMGFVPGMVRVVPPIDTALTRYRADAMRLLAALSDSGLYPAIMDSLRGTTWSSPVLTLWRDDERDILVASRRRVKLFDRYEHFIHEQLVIAERPTGSDTLFTTIYRWASAYDTDETSSMWVERALRVGPAGRFALMLGFRGKEGEDGSLLVRSASQWRDAVRWSQGC